MKASDVLEIESVKARLLGRQEHTPKSLKKLTCMLADRNRVMDHLVLHGIPSAAGNLYPNHELMEKIYMNQDKTAEVEVGVDLETSKVQISFSGSFGDVRILFNTEEARDLEGMIGEACDKIDRKEAADQRAEEGSNLD